jgi:hypothetical protein
MSADPIRERYFTATIEMKSKGKVERGFSLKKASLAENNLLSQTPRKACWEHWTIR